MNSAAVERALTAATRAAFKAGQQQQARRSTEHLALDAAQQYSQQLVMPQVELAMDEAVEQAMNARMAAALDPEPLGDPPLAAVAFGA